MDQKKYIHDYLTECQKNNVPKVEQMEWLSNIINNEVQKVPNNIDINLVEECEAALVELAGANNIFSEHELSLKYENLRNKCGMNFKTNPTKKRKTKLTFLLVALLVISSLIITVASLTENDNIDNFISSIQEVLNMGLGSRFEGDGITVYSHNSSKKYTSMGDWLQTQPSVKLYPAKLPNGYKLESIREIYVDDERFSIFFICNPTDLSISAFNYGFDDFSDNTDNLTEYITNNGLKFYIVENDNTFQAMCFVDSLVYSVTTSNFELLTQTINNIVEVE